MLFMKRKTEEFHFTPEQEACLAKCRELTNDELRILNGGGSYKGMPSSIQIQQGLSSGSSDDNSNSSSGTSASKGHHGMPSDVEAMLEHSGSSSVTETSSNAGQTTVISVTYPTETATQPSAPKQTESTSSASHGSSTASGSGSTNHSSASTNSTSTNNSPSASTENGSSGNGSSPFPKPYAGAYEHGSYVEGERADAEQGTQNVQEVPDSLDEAVEFMQQSDIFQDKTKQSISRGLVEGVYYAEKSRRGFIRKITEFFGIGNTFGRGQIGQNAYNDVKTKLNNELNEYAEMYGIPVPEDVRDAVKIPELEDFIVTSYLCLCIDKGQKNGRSPDDAIKYGTGFYHGGWNSLVTAQSLSGSTLPYVGTEFVLKTGASAWRDIAAYIDDVYAMR